MRFAAIIAALAVTATALPATSLEQTGASLGTWCFCHQSLHVRGTWIVKALANDWFSC
ncbi:hypothetical protein AA0116_g1115 [Alternaria tenuissima]|nr:hypothetical protein AA0116_g1115 [Alternaria tenuissima]